MKIYPPLISLMLFLVMLALHYAVPAPRWIQAPFNLLGFLLMALGVVMNLWAARWFIKQQTPIDPHGSAVYLAQEGLYRFSRNPMYLGMFVSLLGASVYLGSLSTLAMPPLFVWIATVFFIQREERALLEIFGESYRQYKARVRRWI